jgi:hypothetical protein
MKTLRFLSILKETMKTLNVSFNAERNDEDSKANKTWLGPARKKALVANKNLHISFTFPF